MSPPLNQSRKGHVAMVGKEKRPAFGLHSETEMTVVEDPKVKADENFSSSIVAAVGPKRSAF